MTAMMWRKPGARHPAPPHSYWSYLTLWLLLSVSFSWPTSPSVLAQETARPADPLPSHVLIPFDFESQFDNGRYGQMIGDLVWKKLERQGGFILPESMLDVRDWSQRRHARPSHATPLATMRDYLRDFHGQLAIWGTVERVPGTNLDEYDIWVHVADFSQDEPRVIFDQHQRTKTVSEIPHVVIQDALDKLYNRQPSVAAAPDPSGEQRWQTGPNLVSGDFERGTSHPLGWDPIPPYVSRVRVQMETQHSSQVVRFQFDEKVAGTTGVLYYSDYFPVEEGATYRFQCRWRTTGSAAKVFIKCYDELSTEFRESEKSRADRSGALQRREVYRSQQNLQGPAKTWNTHTEDFTPSHTQFTPRWGRVMLYAYWPAGAVDWDDVVVKQIKPPPAGVEPKDGRPALDTKVRSSELEEAQGAKKEPPP